MLQAQAVMTHIARFCIVNNPCMQARYNAILHSYMNNSHIFACACQDTLAYKLMPALLHCIVNNHYMQAGTMLFYMHEQQLYIFACTFQHTLAYKLTYWRCDMHMFCVQVIITAYQLRQSCTQGRYQILELFHDCRATLFFW